jgi:hypothetical protein
MAKKKAVKTVKKSPAKAVSSKKRPNLPKKRTVKTVQSQTITIEATEPTTVFAPSGSGFVVVGPWSISGSSAVIQLSSINSKVADFGYWVRGLLDKQPYEFDFDFAASSDTYGTLTLRTTGEQAKLVSDLNVTILTKKKVVKK